MTGIVGIIGSQERELEELVRKTGMRPVVLQDDQLTASTRGLPVSPPDLVLVDLRRTRSLLAVVSGVKRRFPSLPVAIVVEALDPEVMLEGMRAGVNEVIPSPITSEAFEAALRRLLVPKGRPAGQGHIFAMIGAKGGVGATTLAVNVAEALTKALGEALLVDLHLGSGDAAVFLGVEPRFTVAEALDNTHRLDEAFLRGLLVRTKSGLDLLGSSTHISPGPIDPPRIRALLDFLEASARAVVLDVPRTDGGLLEALESATNIFVVVNQELPTIRNAHPLVRRLRQRYGDRVGVLVNRADRQSEITLEDITKTLGLAPRHVFPNDYRLAISAANKGRPMALSTNGKLAASFHTFVQSLTGEFKAKVTPVEESGRLFGWLGSRKPVSN